MPEQLDITTIINRSIRGIFSLTLAQVINYLLVFLLTIFIDPRTFGVFVVVSASLSFLAYFSDIGLAAALIQKKGKVTREDLKTTFTIQQTLVLIVIAVAFFLSGWVGHFYNLDQPGIWLFQALLISFFLSSLKTIPSIILERKLDFQRLVIPQIIETFVFNLTAVLLAVRGFGITSFTFAVLARGIVGVIAIYLISPWRIGFGFSKESAKKLLSFGVPFQANSLLALIKDDFLIIILGKILSLTEVGYIGFAQKWAFMPLRFLMDKLIRVTFPAFSRLQKDSKNLQVAIEKTIFTVSFFTMPAVVGLALLAPYFVRIIPKYIKWENSLPLITLFAINAILSSISTPLTNMLNAIGKIRITLRLMVFWTIATWVLTLILINFIGFIGVAVASAVISSSVILVVYLARRYSHFDIFGSIAAPLFSTIVMGAVLYFLVPLLVKDILTLILVIIGGGAIYLGTIFLVAKEQMKADLKIILRHLRNSSSQL